MNASPGDALLMVSPHCLLSRRTKVSHFILATAIIIIIIIITTRTLEVPGYDLVKNLLATLAGNPGIIILLFKNERGLPVPVATQVFLPVLFC